MKRETKVITWAIAVLLGSVTLALSQGFVNEAYPPSDVGRWIAEIDAEGDPDGDGGFGLLPADGSTVIGVNQLLFHKGYMIAPLARNAAARGEGTRRGAMASFDISDLSDIKRSFFRQDDLTNEIREAHGLVLSTGDLLCVNTITGVQFWDVSDPTDIRLISDLRIAGMNKATYGTTGWWVMGQHPYYYLGSTQRGLHIIKAVDPANPVLVKRLEGSALGIPSVGSVHCIGNLMVLGSAGQSESTTGPFATFDISDPENPRLLDLASGTGNYSVGVYGNYITTHGGGGLTVWDMADPSNLQPIHHNPGMTEALYSCFADQHFHIPNFRTYEKFDFPIPGAPLLVTSGVPRIDKVHEFTEKLGNLIVATGGGDGDGVKFIPHQETPDTQAPEVNFVSPSHLAINQGVQTRIGVIVTDTLDFESVNLSTMLVREVGGGPLEGKYSYSRNYLNFIPSAPLKENTTYELIVPAGGIKDIVGNGILPFISRFSTGPVVFDSLDPGVVIISPSMGAGVREGFEMAFSVFNFELGTDERSLAWFVDGVEAGTTTSASPISITRLELGTHTLRIDLKQNGEATGVSASVTVTVEPPPPPAANVPPRITLVAPAIVAPGDSVTLDTSLSFDPDNGPDPLTFRWEFLAGPVPVGFTADTAPTTLAVLPTVGDYDFRLTLGDGDLTTSRNFRITARDVPKEALLVTATGGFSGADLAIRDHLVAQGWTVVGIKAQAASKVVAEQYSIVLVSASIGSTNFNRELTTAVVPVVVWESHVLDDLGMTGLSLDTHYGGTSITKAVIPDPPNVLTAGLPSGEVVVFGASTKTAWGLPAPNAIVGATTANGRALLFGYAQGAAMVSGTAPAPRVAVMVGEAAFPLLTPAGLALFDNALDWAAGTPVRELQPAVNIASPTEGATVAGSFTLAFSLSHFALGTDGRSLAWSVDGVQRGTTTSTSPISISGLAEGPHTLRIDLLQNGTATGVSAEVTVSVEPPPPPPANLRPVITLVAPTQVSLGAAVALDASQSSDPDNGPNPLTFRWEMLGGPMEATFTTTAAASTTVDLAAVGDYDFRLTLDDGDLIATRDFRITVRQTPGEVPDDQPAGPGLPNVDHPARFEVLAEFRAVNKSPRGQGFVTMHDGYLFVPFSADGGGGEGTGGFTFYDIANPRSPSVAFTTVGNPVYDTEAGSHFAGDLREPHGFTISEGIACMTMNDAPGDKAGLQFWDFSDIGGSRPGGVDAPLRLSEISLGTLSGGDYSNTAWWVAWQGGRYAYVAGTNHGLFIVDATDPANPVELKQIPIGSLGGFRINCVHVIGNLLVVTNGDSGTGVATFDISDPLNPQVLDVEPGLTSGYSNQMNDNRILVAGDPARVYSIADPGNIVAEAIGPNIANKGGYGVFKDGHFIYGSSNVMVDLDLTATPFVSNGTFAPTGFIGADWDFATTLGNLVFMGNDHDGSALVVGSTTRDTQPPVVTMVSPKDGATLQAVTSRVGLAFSDMVDSSSINTANIQVRPVGGSAVPGRFSNQHGIVNFWPDQNLKSGVTYEVVVVAGGVSDVAGNSIGQTFTSTFRTAPGSFDFEVELVSSGSAPVGESVTFTASSLEPGVEFSFDFGDGTPATDYSTTGSAGHIFQSPGNLSVRVTGRKEGVERGVTIPHVTHLPLTTGRPVRSSTLVYDDSRGWVWSVNPDHGSVSAVNPATGSRVHEIPVGAQPVSLAMVGDEVWVACSKDDRVTVIDATAGTVDRLLPLDYGSRPVGICAAGDGAYVACEGTRTIIAVGPSGAITASVTLPGGPRGVAVTADGSRLFATRFVSPDDAGKLYEIDPLTFQLVRTVDLAIDQGPDTEDSSRGLPNYLFDASISPDGTALWVSSKKDNTGRGLTQDGQPLTFESTVRSIVSAVDLTGTSTSDDAARRIDFNDRGFPAAVAFSSLGNLGFAASMPTNRVEVFDPYLGKSLFSIPSAGLAPRGLILNTAGDRLFVHNELSRNIAVFAIGTLCGGQCFASTPLAVIETVSAEVLPPNVLTGKRHFYNADDLRLNKNSYMACASCHFDGGSDGRVWDFTQTGEGLRNTTSLHHAAGTGLGMIHWSANFDEAQDFENQIRSLNQGLGFLSDEQFAGASDPLGAPKAGLSPDLDALAAYMRSLNDVPASPHREADGALTAAGSRGREIFNSLECSSCHSGESFSDSSTRVLHDVGTRGTGSGGRAGGPLPGFDTPTLLGLWKTAPYLHDGSADDLRQVLTSSNPEGRHGMTAALDPVELNDLIAYLLQIDGSETQPESTPRAYFKDSELLQSGAFGEIVVEGRGASSAIVSVTFSDENGPLGTDGSAPFSWVVPIDSLWIGARVTFSDGSTSELLPLPVRINLAPQIVLVPPATVVPGSSVLLDASLSSDPDNGPGPLTFRWELLAGPVPVSFAEDLPTTSAVLPAEGDYDFRLTLGDGHRSETRDFRITAVAEPQPEVTITAPFEGGVVTADFPLVFSVTEFALGSDGRSLAWFIDGVEAGTTTSTSPISISGLAAGLRTLRVDLLQNGTATGVSASVTVTVEPPPPPPANLTPLIVLVAPTQASSGATLALDASQSSDLDNGPNPLTFRWEMLAGPAAAAIATATAPSTTVSLAGAGDYDFRLTLGDGDLTAVRDFRITVRQTPGKALVVTPTGGFAGTDVNIRDNLVARGITVSGIKAQLVTKAIAETYGLVIVSGTISSTTLNLGMTGATVPVMVLEPYVYDDFGMTARVENVDFGNLKLSKAVIRDPANALTAGLPAVETTLCTKLSPLPWGRPGANAIIGAATASGQALVFGYEQGAAMVSGTAPARRVGMMLGVDTYPLLTPAGLSLFNNGLDWVLGSGSPVPDPNPDTQPEPQPVVSIASPATGATLSGSFTLAFSVTHFALGSDGRSLAWFVDGVQRGTTTSSSPISISGLAAGPHTIRIDLLRNAVPVGVSASVAITVEPPLPPANVAPAITLVAPTIVAPGGSVTLDASLSSDPDDGPSPLTFRWEFLAGPVPVSLTAATSPTTAVVLPALGSYDFRLTLGDGDLIAVRNFRITAGELPREILFVTATGGFSGADLAIRDHLVARGWTVIGIKAQAASRAVAERYGMVLVSESIGSTNFNRELATAAVPLVVWESHVLDDLGMTGQSLDVHYGGAGLTKAVIPNSPNALTAGLPPGEIVVLNASKKAAWGIPGPNAIVGATTANGRALLFGYAQGAAMVSGTAPARRVTAMVGEAAFPLLTPTGLALFDNALDWVMESGTHRTSELEISDSLSFGPLVTSPTPVVLEAVITGGRGRIEYSWEITGADGISSQTPWSTSKLLSQVFSVAGNHTLILRVRDDGGVKTRIFRLVVHVPLSENPASSSSGLALANSGSKTVWNVNPDNDSVSVLNAITLAALAEIPVAADPRSLLVMPNNEIWVASHDDPSVTVISQVSRSVIERIDLPRGSAPEGMVVAEDRVHAYVALRGTGGIGKINVATRQVDSILNVGPTPKGLAVGPSGTRLFVTHFISPDQAGKVTEIDLTTFSVVRVIDLAISTRPDSISSGRGLPNYLGDPGISPDGAFLLIPSKQDNILRGTARDGTPLSSENTVRSIVSKVDLATGEEVPSARWDINDSDSPNAVAFSPLGNLVFVSLQGNNSVAVLDAYNRREVARFEVEAAPDALLMDRDSGVLYVHQFLDRSVAAYSVGDLSLLRAESPILLAKQRVVADEKLDPQVMLGKKVFYNAADPRMSSNGYISCATCHLDGDSDGRVWDFTDRGEGLRNTIDLRGRAGTGHGRIHWSGNFDEVQDFENDIRLHFGGLGFLSQSAFNETSASLGEPKAGRSFELDALAAYVSSLHRVPESPHRNSDGSLTTDAVRGREVFERLNCASCHAGDEFTDSARMVLHNVGTLKPGSGARAGAALTGIDTPTLKGLWVSAPYFHDGSAKTLNDVVDSSGPEHGNMAALDDGEKNDIIAYLYQLEQSDSNRGVAFLQIHLNEGVANARLPAGFASDVAVLPGSDLVENLSCGVVPFRDGEVKLFEVQVRILKGLEIGSIVQTSTDCKVWKPEAAQKVILDDTGARHDVLGFRVPLAGRPVLFVKIPIRELQPDAMNDGNAGRNLK